MNYFTARPAGLDCILIFIKAFQVHLRTAHGFPRRGARRLVMGIARFTVLSLVFAGLALPGTGFAKEYKASLAQMPVYAESAEKGVLVDLVKALAKESGQPIKFEVVPFARSMENVTTGKADFHMPLIQVPDGDESKLNYSHSTETIFHVNFVLFSNKAKPLDMKKLGSYKLETDRAHTGYFPFTVEPTSSLEASLKKVDAGRIDGFIFADFASDPIIKAQKLGNIKRQLYKVFDVKIILPKGGDAKETDKFLSNAIAGLRKSGQFEKIMGPIDVRYDDWQP